MRQERVIHQDVQGLNAPIFHDIQGVAIEFGQNSTNETWQDLCRAVVTWHQAMLLI